MRDDKLCSGLKVRVPGEKKRDKLFVPGKIGLLKNSKFVGRHRALLNKFTCEDFTWIKVEARGVSGSLWNGIKRTRKTKRKAEIMIKNIMRKSTISQKIYHEKVAFSFKKQRLWFQIPSNKHQST